MKRLTTLLALTALTAACDNGAFSAPPTPDARTQGIATEPWDQYCTVAFTRDVPEHLEDYGDIDQPDPFIFAAGTTWLVGNDRGLREDTIQLLYLADGATARLDIPHDPADPGFESSCDLETAQMMYGVFSDVTLYADVELTQPACVLAAGTAVPTDIAGSQHAGPFSLLGENTVELQLGDLSAECGGRETAFMQEGNLRVGATTRNAPRVQTFLAAGE